MCGRKKNLPWAPVSSSAQWSSPSHLSIICPTMQCFFYLIEMEFYHFLPSTPHSHPPSYSSVLTTLKLITSFSLIISITYNHKHTQTHTHNLLSSFLLSLCIWFQKLTTLHWTINNGANYRKRLTLLLSAISSCSSLSSGGTPWKFSPSMLRCPLRLALF